MNNFLQYFSLAIFSNFWHFLAYLPAYNSKIRLHPSLFSFEPVRQSPRLTVFADRCHTAWWRRQKMSKENRF